MRSKPAKPTPKPKASAINKAMKGPVRPKSAGGGYKTKLGKMSRDELIQETEDSLGDTTF